MAFDRKEYYQRTKQKQLETVKAWREANQERSNATNAKSRESQKFRDPTAFLLSRTKDRAVKQDIEFNITVDDIAIPTTCPMLGIALFFPERGTITGKNPNSPSVDRIDPNQGYVKGNVMVISWRANQLKNDSTLEEMEMIVAFRRKQLVD